MCFDEMVSILKELGWRFRTVIDYDAIPHQVTWDIERETADGYELVERVDQSQVLFAVHRCYEKSWRKGPI